MLRSAVRCVQASAAKKAPLKPSAAPKTFGQIADERQKERAVLLAKGFMLSVAAGTMFVTKK